MVETILNIVGRSVAVYLFVVLAIRLFGKRELAQLSIVDLVLILLISNSVQNAMVGDNTSLLGGLVAAASLFGVNYVLKTLLFRSKKLSETIQGHPLVLVYNGNVLQKNLEEAKLTQEEVDAAVREHGVAGIAEVNLAVLEVDGNISVLSDNFRRKTVRKRQVHKVATKQN
ncbi:MAG: YetF domain-containing protein [Bacteroidota bacterium]|jgi:uncharacterized membrane protein YcaP (DUF421 family)